jgi:2Fe-2S ferredoxin
MFIIIIRRALNLCPSLPEVDMTHIVVTTRSGEVLNVPAPAGSSVMEAIREAGIDDLAALCGGSCSCATCHVYVDAAQLATLQAVSEAEDDLLDGSEHRKENSRLSCQIVCAEERDGLRVTIAPEG